MKMKKMLSLILALAMVMSMSVGAFAMPEVEPAALKDYEKEAKAFFINLGELGETFRSGGTRVSIVVGENKILTTKEPIAFEGDGKLSIIVDGIIANNPNGENTNQWGYEAKAVKDSPLKLKVMPLTNDKSITAAKCHLIGFGGHDFVETEDINITYLPVSVSNAITAIGRIGEVDFSEESNGRIALANEAFNAITSEEEKALVVNKALLDAANTKLADKAAAEAVDALIAGLPAPESIELANEEKVNEAKAAYDKLNDNAKLLVTKKADLEKAVNKINTLKAAEADKAAAKAVADKIAALGDITLEKETAIKEARAAHTALTEAQKALVKNLNVLEAAETKLAELKDAQADKSNVKDAEDKINAIGKVTFTPECKAKIDAAKEAYNALNADLQKEVTNIADLQKAENQYKALDTSTVKNIVEPMNVLTKPDGLSSSDSAAADVLGAAQFYGVEDAVPAVSNEEAIALLKVAGANITDTTPVEIKTNIKYEINVVSIDTTKGNEKVVLDITPKYSVTATADSKTVTVVNETKIETLNGKNVSITVTLPSVFSKENILITHNGNYYHASADSSGKITFINPHGFSQFVFTISDNSKPTVPVTVLNGLYKIDKDKNIIKATSNNIKFGESVYIVVGKNGVPATANAADMLYENFITDSDEVKKLKLSKFKYTENEKLIDGKIEWQKKLVKIGSEKKAVWLIEIPIKENKSYTSFEDVLGSYELKTYKPFYTRQISSTEFEMGGNYDFAFSVNPDTKPSDEIYEGPNAYEFNNTEDDELTLYGGEGLFIVDTRGQDDLVIDTDVKYNEGIEKADPNANYVYYNANYATFNKIGTLYLYGDRHNFVYKVDKNTGKLSPANASYDVEEEAYKIRTRTLGCYVIAEKELDLDKINKAIAPEGEVKPVNPVKPPVIVNPPTGAEI